MEFPSTNSRAPRAAVRDCCPAAAVPQYHCYCSKLPVCSGLPWSALVSPGLTRIPVGMRKLDVTVARSPEGRTEARLPAEARAGSGRGRAGQDAFHA